MGKPQPALGAHPCAAVVVPLAHRSAQPLACPRRFERNMKPLHALSTDLSKELLMDAGSSFRKLAAASMDGMEA
jgi:hypothetical protein